jgi:hypothetical protein
MTPKPEKGNALLICYYFPPIKSIAVWRNYRVAKALSTYFEEIHILSTTNVKHLQQEHLPMQNMQIRYLRTFDYRTINAIIRRIRGKKENITHFSEQQKSSRLAQLAVQMTKSFPFNLLWGEGGALYWLHALILGSRLIRKNNIQFIYSSYMPYSDHFAAYCLKCCFPKVFWLADFRDLHVEPVYKNVIWSRFQHRCNRFLLRKADLVTTVSFGLERHLKNYHHQTAVLRNGVDKISGQYAPTDDAQSPHFNITYTGSMFTDERSPYLLLTALNHLMQEQLIERTDIKIIYAGKDAEIWNNWLTRSNLSDLLLNFALVSTEKAQELQRTSHLNLLLTSASPDWSGVMTGKFYEYLAARKPIIVLINGSFDPEFEAVMRELNNGIVVYDQTNHSEQAVQQQRLEHFLLQHYQRWKNGESMPTLTEMQVEKFEFEKSFQTLFEEKVASQLDMNF